MRLVRAAALLAILATLAPASALAGRRQSISDFHAAASATVATVEFTQEFVAGGQRQQTRSLTDGVVITADGLVLISGRVRFPQRGSSGRLSGGSLPELGGFRLWFADGREHTAEVVGFDDDLNLGLLRITDLDAGQEAPHVDFLDGYRAKVGAGLRSLTLYTEEYGREPVYQPMMVNALLDTPQEAWSLSGASSSLLGAPLWDDRGRVVGVVAALPMSPWGGRSVVPDLSGPLGLPYHRFAPWLEATIEEARREVALEQPPAEEQAWMGVMFQPLEKAMAEHLGVSPGGGIIITRVVPTSPAEVAGVQALDIFVELDDERIAVLQISDSTRFSRRIRGYEPGTEVRFTRERPGGEQDEVKLVLAPTPLSELHADRRQDEAFELTVRQLTMDTLLGQRLAPDTPGVVVDGVTRAGWAGLSGLNPGLIIQRINEHDVTDLDSFTAAMAAVEASRPDQVLFFVRHGRTTRFFVAEPDWDEEGQAP